MDGRGLFLNTSFIITTNTTTRLRCFRSNIKAAYPQISQTSHSIYQRTIPKLFKVSGRGPQSPFFFFLVLIIDTLSLMYIQLLQEIICHDAQVYFFQLHY